MKISISDYLQIAFCVAALAAGQIMFKHIGLRTTKLIDIPQTPSLLAMLVGALALYAASTLVWVNVLRRIPLSYAYVFMALGFVIVPMAGVILYKEPLTTKLMLGAALIVIGIYVSAR